MTFRLEHDQINDLQMYGAVADHGFVVIFPDLCPCCDNIACPFLLVACTWGKKEVVVLGTRAVEILLSVSEKWAVKKSVSQFVYEDPA